MQDELISVIVPIYKVEQYLEKCLDSVIAQTYENLEIILVDDGSPDNCGRICDEYKLRDGRIKVIHQANGGLSVARNAGLDIATGDCIGFVDPDDWIDPNYYEHLMGVMEGSGSDIVQCDMHYHKSGMTPIMSSPAEKYHSYTLSNFKSILEHRGDGRITQASPLNLYKTPLWEGLRFSVGHYKQDAIIFPEITSRCNSLTYTDLKLYHFNWREDSITHKEKTLTHIRSREKVISVYFQLYEDKPEYKEIVAFFICKILAESRWYAHLASSTSIDKPTVKAHTQGMHIVFRTCFKDAKKYAGYKKASAKHRMYWHLFHYFPSIALRIAKSYFKVNQNDKKSN